MNKKAQKGTAMMILVIAILLVMYIMAVEPIYRLMLLS